MLLKALIKSEVSLSGQITPPPSPRLTLSSPVLASASLSFLFRCHEDLRRCFTRVCRLWILRYAGLCRTGRCSAPETSGSIKEVMSPEEFKAAGLNKLSAEELQKLDAWLQGYRQVTEQAAEKESYCESFRRVPRQDGSACKSR